MDSKRTLLPEAVLRSMGVHCENVTRNSGARKVQPTSFHAAPDWHRASDSRHPKSAYFSTPLSPPPKSAMTAPLRYVDVRNQNRQQPPHISMQRQECAPRCPSGL